MVVNENCCMKRDMVNTDDLDKKVEDFNYLDLIAYIRIAVF